MYSIVHVHLMSAMRAATISKLFQHCQVPTITADSESPPSPTHPFCYPPPPPSTWYMFCIHYPKNNLNLGINTKPPTAGGDATRCTRTCILSCFLTNLVLKITFSFSSDISLGYLCKISACRDIKRSAKYCRIMMEICTPGWKHAWWPMAMRP